MKGRDNICYLKEIIKNVFGRWCQKKSVFSIRKFSVGAASVLIGFTFVSMAGSHKVQAADVADKSVVVDTFNKDKSQ